MENLKKRNLELQNEKLEYDKTIREQDQRIKDLTEKLHITNIIKNYWWFAGLGIAIGGFVGRNWDKLLALFGI